MESTRAELELIPLPSKARYLAIKSLTAWQNPYLTIQGSMVTLHVTLRSGSNAHHVAEACFKAAARALRMAVAIDPRFGDLIPSTKGAL